MKYAFCISFLLLSGQITTDVVYASNKTDLLSPHFVCQKSRLACWFLFSGFHKAEIKVFVTWVFVRGFGKNRLPSSFRILANVSSIC